MATMTDASKATTNNPDDTPNVESTAPLFVDETLTVDGVLANGTGELLVAQSGSDDGKSGCIVIEQKKQPRLVYTVSQVPPPHLTFLFALQQTMFVVSAALTIALLVAEVVCARDNHAVKTRIMSTTFFMIGLSTFAMSTFGVRLPICQGPAISYIVPLLALQTVPEWQCPSQEYLVMTVPADYYRNQSTTLLPNGHYPIPEDEIMDRVQKLSGSLVTVGVLHFLIGVLGLVGFILKFVGPITMVPTIVLVGLSLHKTASKFSETYWGIAVLTAALSIVFSLHLRKRQTPIPFWSRRRGLHIIWFPFHQVFAILISMIIGWAVAAIFTSLDLISADPKGRQLYARTDIQFRVVTDASWISLPYPGQFGAPSFYFGAFVSLFIATIESVIDSLCDYSTCARACYVPEPPVFAVNRGIAVEGIMSTLSGLMGACHSTVSYGSSIGAIGLTKVASRRVFQVIGVMYIVFALVGKVGAFFVAIPYCVVGGVQVSICGIFIGVVLSNLERVDLKSARNLAILGIALFTGLMLPAWMGRHPDGIHSGNKDVDRIVSLMLSNPVFVGGVLACFLDNTVPGTPEERGLVIQTQETRSSGDEEHNQDNDHDDEYEDGMEVYVISWIPDRVRRSRLARYIRFFAESTHTGSLAKNQV